MVAAAIAFGTVMLGVLFIALANGQIGAGSWDDVPLRSLAQQAVGFGMAAAALGAIFFIITRWSGGGHRTREAVLLGLVTPLGAGVIVLAVWVSQDATHRLPLGTIFIEPSPAIQPPAFKQHVGEDFVERIATDLDFVTSLTSDSSGRIIFTEFRTGNIGALEPQSDGRFDLNYFARVPIPAEATAEQGLWHSVLDPQEDFLYAMAIDSLIPHTSRIVRIPYNDAHGGKMETVLDSIPAGRSHSGGALAFGPEGNLYLTVGYTDALPQRARSPETVQGTISWLTPGILGSYPTEQLRTYAYGFRNPYGIAFNPNNGYWYLVDNGVRCCDRLFRIEQDRYHGWPDYMHGENEIIAMERDPAVVAPIYDSGASGVAPTQLLVYLGSRYGEEFKDNLFFPGFTSRNLHRIVLDEDGLKTQDDLSYEFANANQLVAITSGPDGYIYLSTGTAVFRIKEFP